MVYVDNLAPADWPLGPSCHLIADTLDELHEFAAKLRIPREWFQDHRIPHYDLVAVQRTAAVIIGAKEVTRRELMRIARRAQDSGA